MMIGIVLGSVVLLAVLVSITLLVRDVRGLHRRGHSLAERPVDAAGVSAAGMVWQSNVGSR